MNNLIMVNNEKNAILKRPTHMMVWLRFDFNKLICYLDWDA